MSDAIQGALIGAGATLIAGSLVILITYKLQAWQREKGRIQQVVSILSIIYSELKVEKSAWEQKPKSSSYKKLIGFDLLKEKGLQDVLSISLVQSLMDVYLNLSRMYSLIDNFEEEANKLYFQLDGFSENIAQQKRDFLIDQLVSSQQGLVINSIDRCISRIQHESKLRGWKISE